MVHRRDDELLEAFEKRLTLVQNQLDTLERIITPFFRLAPEIRLQIYRHLLPQKRLVDTRNPGFLFDWCYGERPEE